MVIYSKTFLDDDLIEKLNFYILFLVGGSWEQSKSANCRFQIEFDECIPAAKKEVLRPAKSGLNFRAN